MSNSKSASILNINFQPAIARWVLLLPALIAIFGATAAARWYVGNTIAEYARPLDEGGLEMARVAVRWAPSDPLTHWRLGAFEQKSFGAENLAASVREFQLAVEGSPNDYRYWMELGRALEASGDPGSAEKALRQAVELAPSYSQPRWFYGNLLLRQGKIDQAFNEFARVAVADESMQPAIFGVAMQAFNGDVDQIVKTLPAPSVRLRFAFNLVGAGRIDDAMRVLRTVDAAEKRSQSTVADGLVKSLIEHKKYHDALALLREIEPQGTQSPEPDHFWNGDFEQPLKLADPKPFRWLVENRGPVQIAVDSQSHSGQGSLRLIFKASGKLDAIPISQTIITDPNTQYRLQYYQRTEGLTSASPPQLVVADAVDNAMLAKSDPVPTGTNGWQLVTIDFNTRADHEGIVVTLRRGPCDDSQSICPIFGTVWYDDFNLQRRSGGNAAAANRTGSSAR